MDNNFYLTLMSNSSLNFYEENTTSSFTVHLPTEIQLTGAWAVGVAELHYPYNFFNVTEGENKITIDYNATPDADTEENTIAIEHLEFNLCDFSGILQKCSQYFGGC